MFFEKVGEEIKKEEKIYIGKFGGLIT